MNLNRYETITFIMKNVFLELLLLGKLQVYQLILVYWIKTLD
jgi:hypothetical protein